MRRRNIVFLGSVGAGKSTTCNAIFRTDSNNSEPFEVAHDESLSTKTIFRKACKPKNLTLIDTPGFGNNQLSEKKVNETLSQLSSIFTEPNSKIDAFVLVVRLTPRAQTLKTDLERIRTVFGRAGLKSTILLLIYSNKKGSTGDFLEKLEQMEEISKLLIEGKQEEPTEDWFCLWDNINPRDGQEEELFRKLEKLTPYTQNDFLKAQHHLKFYHEVHFKEELASKKAKPSKVEDKEERFTGITEADLEESLKKIMEIMEMRQVAYKFRIDDVLKKNSEMFEKFMKRVEELESKDKQEEKRKETLRLIRDLICRRRKFEEEEQTELIGTTLTEGAKKTAETSARSIGGKIGQKIGQVGGKGIHKEGEKLIKGILG